MLEHRAEHSTVQRDRDTLHVGRVSRQEVRDTHLGLRRETRTQEAPIGQGQRALGGDNYVETFKLEGANQAPRADIATTTSIQVRLRSKY